MRSDSRSEADAEYVCYWCEDTLSSAATRRYLRSLNEWQAAKEEAFGDDGDLDFDVPEPFPACDTCYAEIDENHEEFLKTDPAAGYRNAHWWIIYGLLVLFAIGLAASLFSRTQ